MQRTDLQAFKYVDSILENRLSRKSLILEHDDGYGEDGVSTTEDGIGTNEKTSEMVN